MNKLTRVPDFFIVGAPKCGTTSLFNYLAGHPDVFMPPKEVHFFGSDLYPKERLHDHPKYVELFASAITKRVGEASVWYLYSTQAAEEISEFSPDARIIILLRNPVDMLYSLHSELVCSGVEDIADFATAIEAELKTSRSLPIWGSAEVVTQTRYLIAASYYHQVRRYFQHFGRKRVAVVIFDDLQMNPSRVYRDLCSFLDISSEYEAQFQVANPNKQVRSKTLRAIMQRPPEALKVVGRLLTTNASRQTLLKGAQRLNTKYVPRQPMPATLRQELQLYFSDDVCELSNLLDRDLTYWCRSSSGQQL
jgi:hypothetical protein